MFRPEPRAERLLPCLSLATGAALATLRRRNAERLRRMYVGGKGNRAARRYLKVWAWVFGKGLGPGRRWMTLEVPVRKSGKPTRFPFGPAAVDGHSYLVSMLGNDCHWVRNVRANDGNAVIERRGRRPARLVKVPIQKRPYLLKAYLRQVPGARPHVPVAHIRPVADFEPVAGSYPVFRIEWTE